MVAQTFDRFLALWMWKLKVLEAYEGTLLSTYCQPGMTVLDIGSNIGFHTLRAARSVGDAGRVYAFEPDPYNANTLRHNVALNHLSNVTVIEKAVGKKNGTVSLWTSGYHSGDHRIYRPTRDCKRQQVKVDIVALDEFFDASQQIDLIKMDIQGAEGLALRGMRRVLDSNPAIILLMELWPSGISQTGCSPEAELNNLERSGFVLDSVNEEGKELVRIKDIRTFIHKLSNKRYANILARRPKVAESASY